MLVPREHDMSLLRNDVTTVLSLCSRSYVYCSLKMCHFIGIIRLVSTMYDTQWHSSAECVYRSSKGMHSILGWLVL